MVANIDVYQSKKTKCMWNLMENVQHRPVWEMNDNQMPKVEFCNPFGKNIFSGYCYIYHGFLQAHILKFERVFWNQHL